MAESGRSALFLFLHGVVKVVALAVGFTIAALGLIAVQGVLYENFWARLAVAAVLLVVIPITIADKLLPKEQTEETRASAKGLITDVTALTWMLSALAVVALGPSAMHGPLTAESQRFRASESPRAAKLSAWLASRPEPEPAADAASDPVPEDTKDSAGAGDAKAGDVKAAGDDADAKKAEDGADAKASDAGADAKADGDGETGKPAADEGDREQQTPEQLFEGYAPAVVTITVTKRLGQGAGTGFFVDDKGTVATNSHVIHDADSVKVKFFDGKTNDKVKLIAEDPDIDLALLTVELDDKAKPVNLGDSERVKVGEQVIVIGNPLGLEHTLTDGLVSSRRLYKGKKFIQMSAPVSPGNSGGPVFNRYGEVVGVTVAKLMMGIGENLNLAIPVNELKKMIEADHESPRGFGASSW